MAKLFKSVTYRREYGYIYRLHELIRDSYHTEDGGYVPQRVVYVHESEVFKTHADYDDAVTYCDELERPY